MIEDFRDPRRRRGARRPARPPRADALPGPDRRTRAGSTGSRSTTCASWSTYWRDDYDWRAQEARPQRARAVPHRRSTASRSTSSTRARRTPTRVPLLLDARLARLDRRVPRRHPAAHRPGGARRSRRRRVPRRRAVAAGLRLLGTDPHTRLGHVAHRARVRRADGPARLRRATARRVATGARRSRRGSARSIPSTARRSTSTCRSPSPPEDAVPLTDAGQGRPRRDAALPARRGRLRARAGRPSRRRSVSRSTTRRPGCSRGSSRSSARGATATATPRTSSPATSCSPT